MNNTSRSTTTPAERQAERALVVRAQLGEIDAIESILDLHRGRIERLAHSIVKNPMDAEEVAQDVMMTVTHKIDRFRGDASLSTWIHRIAINAALMHRRRDKSSTVVSIQDAPPIVERRDLSGQPRKAAADPTLQQEFWEKVWGAVDCLDDKYRTAFILRDVEGLSTEDAATALGLKVPALKSRLHRARIALREQLTTYFEADTKGLLEPALAA
ncbi:MAG: sigma-70 family RNA polymerase sigma factor [Gemmatimonadetes bacterium]|nr:sigma-70 family RNA polymerase sigma factor [Gemmatimonadota bacterium]MBT6144052.1 sigma-70 family RNA polymerase sigma factor [Gemmatimonadota bacterium]MBT7864221.1 sigma-70 family RNA polymerase sigma factor [Gemmatimonadota bacterium]